MMERSIKSRSKDSPQVDKSIKNSTDLLEILSSLQKNRVKHGIRFSETLDKVYHYQFRPYSICTIHKILVRPLQQQKYSKMEDNGYEIQCSNGENINYYDKKGNFIMSKSKHDFENDSSNDDSEESFSSLDSDSDSDSDTSIKKTIPVCMNCILSIVFFYNVKIQ